MKKREMVQVEAIAEITCDRCMKCFTKDDAGWHEMQSIEFVGGYESIFGDGMSVSIDLCQNCLKETLGPWLRIEPGAWLSRMHIEMSDMPQTGGTSDETLLHDQTETLRKKTKNEEASASLDDTLRDLPPPKGYPTWLHYAVDSMETRSLEIEWLFDSSDDRLDKFPSRDEMQAAAQKELALALKGTVLKYEDATEPVDPGNPRSPIDRLKGTLRKPLVQVSVDDMHPRIKTGDQISGEALPGMSPVGKKFGADSARFARVLQRAVAVFGSPLAAVQWLTAFNAALDSVPMKRAIDGEEGSEHIMAILSDIDKDN